MKITREFLEKLKPCSDLWDNYLKFYSEWSGSFSEFLELEKISTEDKLWLFFHEVKEWEHIQREFAILCAARAVDDCNIAEVHEYFNLILLAHNEDILQEIKTDEAYSAADWEAYWEAYRAAYWAADWEAYRAADRVAYRAAHSAADRVAYRAADSAAYWAGEPEIQLIILKNLVDEQESGE